MPKITNTGGLAGSLEEYKDKIKEKALSEEGEDGRCNL